uniref:Uncharacterized protein n=1 Tax=Anguilla anguilla TaxID=7936 RepID=A0A0E9WUL4_ANGAN
MQRYSTHIAICQLVRFVNGPVMSCLHWHRISIIFLDILPSSGRQVLLEIKVANSICWPFFFVHSCTLM